MIVYGASGHGKVIIEILESIHDPNIQVWDDADKPPIWEYSVQRPMLGITGTKHTVVIGIGVNAVRRQVANRLSAEVTFGTAVHATAYFSKRVEIGEGTVVMAGAVMNPDVSVGKHCIINTCASIDHDCMLADYVHISPNATLSGNVSVGEGTHVGSGAAVIQGIKIGKWCTIGAGAVVTTDIPDYATAVGSPARVIKIKETENEI